jgi:hypothetical protein
LRSDRQLAGRTPRAGGAETSDRGRAQHLAPVRNPFFQRALASIRKFIEVNNFEELKLSAP